MRLLVTGAAGFIGGYTAAAALERGHDVRALVRSRRIGPSGHPVLADGRVDVVAGDLRSGRSLRAVLDGIDAVIHLAGVKVGDFPTQFLGTVRSTELLLDEMRSAGARRLVGVSSLAVYDFCRLRAGDVLTERSPIEDEPGTRSAYARTKLEQERLFVRFGTDHDVAIVRPGLVYGRDHLRHALLGVDVGPYHLRVGSRRRLPMLYVGHCAEALVLAAERLERDAPPLVGGPVNLVDSDLPTCREYERAIGLARDVGTVVPVPWTAMRAFAGLVDVVNRSCYGGRAMLPNAASRPEVHTRFKPLGYSNHRARTVLGWTPRHPWQRAVAMSASSPPREGMART